MNIKNFDTNKINLKKNKIILIYGKNEGLKNNFKKKLIGEYKNILSYDQNDIFGRGVFKGARILILKH